MALLTNKFCYNNNNWLLKKHGNNQDAGTGRNEDIWWSWLWDSRKALSSWHRKMVTIPPGFVLCCVVLLIIRGVCVGTNCLAPGNGEIGKWYWAEVGIQQTHIVGAREWVPVIIVKSSMYALKNLFLAIVISYSSGVSSIGSHVTHTCNRKSTAVTI